jgi:Icc-related predicted phosphoesterase
MRVLCITDLHGRVAALDRIAQDAGEADVLLLGGDITDFGTPNVAEQLVRRAQQLGDTVFAVAGNCDSKAIDDRLTEIGVSLFGRGIVHQGVGFCGVSAMPPWMGNMYELTEAEIAEVLRKGHGQLTTRDQDVLLSHTPPRGTKLDETRTGDHVGSSSVREFIEFARPALVVCGHIHESRGIDRIGPATIVNCGPAYRGHYAVAEVNTEVTVELRTAD